MSETLTLAEVELSELVSRVHSQHERVTVTVYGRPSAVETIAVLSDSDALRQLAAGLSDERCNWSDTPSLSLAGRTVHDGQHRGHDASR